MTEDNKEPGISKRKSFGGLFIAAGACLGMGIGWAVDAFLPGLFIGIGVGFLLFALILIFAKD